MKVDYIQCGNAIELLKNLPDDSVDCVITSPPYFNLRNYECENQIGTEETIDDYLNNLISVFSEVYRVLKSTGSLWINIDDVYSKKHSLMCIPDRLKIKLVDTGWICRNEVIWHKPNAMPSSAKNRFNNDYEKFYFFVKSNDYVFNTQYEPFTSTVAKNVIVDKRKKSKYIDVTQEASVRQGLNKARGTKIVSLRKNLPSQKEFVDFMRSRCTIGQICENSNIKKSTIEHWFRRDKCGFSFPTVDDWNTIKYLIDDWSDEFKKMDEQLNDVTYETDDILKNADKGRLKRTVWNISTKAFKGHHYAAYPEALIKTPVLACTNEGDIVLDPFIGSGTTAVVCVKNNRHYIGFDLNETYCEIAKERINGAVKEGDASCH